MEQRNTTSYDAKLVGQQHGSVVLSVGWTLLAMAMLVGIYCFQDFREGTHFWLAYDGSMAFVGLLTIGYGMRLRRSTVRISN